MAQMSPKQHQAANVLALNFHLPTTHPEASMPMTDAKVLGIPPEAPEMDAFCL